MRLPIFRDLTSLLMVYDKQRENFAKEVDCLRIEREALKKERLAFASDFREFRIAFNDLMKDQQHMINISSLMARHHRMLGHRTVHSWIIKLMRNFQLVPIRMLKNTFQFPSAPSRLYFRNPFRATRLPATRRQ